MRRRTARLARLKMHEGRMLEAAKSNSARIGRELEQMRRHQAEIQGAISSQFERFGSLAALGATRMRIIERRIRDLTDDWDRCKAESLRRAGRTKVLDRLHAAADLERRALLEKSDLMDQIELALIFDKTSLA